MRGSAVLCGFYGRRNLGDEALLAGLLQALAAAGQPDGHHVLTPAPHAVRADHRVAASRWDGTARGRRAAVRDLELTRVLVRHPHFLLGGGDLLRDSPTQDVAQVWLRPARLALQLRRRVGVVGVSVGEIHRDDTRRTIRDTLDHCSLVTVRDDASAAALRDLGVQTPVHVLPDLALSLTAPVDRLLDGRVVLCLRGLADRAGPVATRALDQALDALADALRTLPEGTEVQLVPLRSSPHSFGPVDDDYVAGLEFLARARLARPVEVVRHVPDVAALIDLLSRADVVVGMRLHSLVLAVGLDRPVVGLAYDRKVTGFLDDLGGREAVRPLEDVTAAWLRACLRTALDQGTRGYDQSLAQQAQSRSTQLVELLRAW